MSTPFNDDDLDTTVAKSEILKRIRSLQSRPVSLHNNEVTLAKGYINRHNRGPAPKPVENVVALFEEKSRAMLCTVQRVKTEQAAAQACADYLAEHQLEGTVAIWPALKHMDWTVLTHESRVGAPTGDDLIGISAVAYAVAETGTLVFASQPDQPASTHLLPETHVAIVREDQVVHTMEDAFERLRKDGRAMPRALNFVSGPSRTADIEQTIVLGAHGPYRVHLILVGK
ncbi:MAG: lactate utilization protein [Limnobacter sp.]|uniref:LutC/YkgG family protein n=1 Tax=Limnobacter sp. TaxID=2003368 RepID=UPI0032EE7E36